jgi:hypothetical protein
MAKLVQFTEAAAGLPIAVNPAFIVKMHPDPKNDKNVTVLHLHGTDANVMGVKGEWTEVIRKLAAAV